MATAPELKQIYNDSFIDRSVATGDQILAIDLRDKVDVAMWRLAHAQLTSPALPPAANEEARQRRNEAIGWSQKAAGNAALERLVFQLMLAGLPEDRTKAQILAMDGAAVAAAITPLMQPLARGAHPGR